MKKLLAISVCAMLLAAPAWAQKKSAVSFDSYEYDFGNVNATASRRHLLPSAR